MVELAVTVDFGEPFVKGTYKLEGDGPLALECYEIISGIKAAVQVRHLPNTNAVANQIASVTKSKQCWMDYAKACIQPGIDYFTIKFESVLQPAVNAFKAARLFFRPRSMT